MSYDTQASVCMQFVSQKLAFATTRQGGKRINKEVNRAKGKEGVEKRSGQRVLRADSACSANY